MNRDQHHKELLKFKNLTKRIKNNRAYEYFKQQTLPSTKYLLTLYRLGNLLLLCSIPCVIFGFAVLFYNLKLVELTFEYTDCKDSITNVNCDYFRGKNVTDKSLCQCYIYFELHQEIKKPVYIYYVLGNYNQNHRLYASSLNLNQLDGSTEDTGSECEPYRQNPGGLHYAPCGIIANSLFNDSITLEKEANSSYQAVPLMRTGIAWPYDKNRFNNPPDWNNKIHPPSWIKNVWELDPMSESNNGYENEDFIVWMKVSATQTIKKFYRRVNHSDANYVGGLSAGMYRFRVEYNYPVLAFRGFKKVILTNTGFLGARRIFIPIIYLILGVIMLILAPLIHILDCRLNKKNKRNEEEIDF